MLHPRKQPYRAYVSQRFNSCVAGLEPVPAPPPRISAIEIFNGKPPTMESVAQAIRSRRIKNMVIVCGAGISTSAGIPDFRSPITGLYASLASDRDLPTPEHLFDLQYFTENPKQFLEQCQSLWPFRPFFPAKEHTRGAPKTIMRRSRREVRPTPTHLMIRILCEMGVVRRVYTQNIDGLELMAGVPEEQLVECHGNFKELHCTNTQQCEFQLRWLKQRHSAREPPGLSYDEAVCRMICHKTPIRCPRCAEGWLKPSVVFFGEPMPAKFYDSLEDDLQQCDFMLVLGTSLTVQPVASMPERVSQEIGRMLFNNTAVGTFKQDEKDDTTPRRDVVVLGDMDESAQALVQLLRKNPRLATLCKEVKCRTARVSNRKRTRSS